MSHHLRSLDPDLIRGEDLVNSLAEDLGLTFEEAHEAFAPIAEALLRLPSEELYTSLRAVADGDFSG